ncbi:facilitated trehalose transporter Tret1-like isoform X1 [Dermacentor andersoni]|uniref:facilitated trehalose transporter Tret1-like isoform X1 n=1 Tax=Dermacentor andersoni TaxID=34620 RepID=UPI002155E363|nr:facilitated trehalose transporter Tret1-like isoform X1 [Dermacentor andersoni]
MGPKEERRPSCAPDSFHCKFGKVPNADDAYVPTACSGTEKDAKRRLYLTVATAYMASISFGYSCTYSSPALPDIRKSIEFSASDSRWFGSLVTLGAVFGGLAGGQLLNLIGRRGALFAAAAWFMAGWLCIMFAPSTALLFVGRVLTGIAVGITALTVAVFISEISPSNIRGLLNTGANAVLCVGILLTFSLGKFLSYRWLAAFCLAPSVIMALALFWVHESPHWLLQKGRRKAAIASLHFYQGPKIAEELSALDANLANHQPFALLDVTMPYFYKPFFCTLLSMFMQQASAVCVILFYAQDIFEDAGTSIAADDCTIIVGALQVVVLFVATVLIDRLGRKVLLIVSSVGSSASLVLLGISFHLKATRGQEFLDSFGWLPLLAIAIYFVSYAIGLGPLPWVLLGEMIPLRGRGFATGVCTAFLFALAFLVTKCYDDLVKLMTEAGTYWMFAGLLTGSLILFIFIVPETKGKSLEEIELIFGKTDSSASLDTLDKDVEMTVN